MRVLNTNRLRTQLTAGLIICLVISPVLCRNVRTASPQTKLERIRAQYGLVGYSVAAIYQDRLVFQEFGGYADIAAQTPIHASTVFRFASISKTVTAIAVMQLVEKGSIKLDDDISEILGYTVRNPHFPNAKITVRQILSHTSGLSDTEEYSKDACAKDCSDFIWDSHRPNPPALREIMLPGGRYYSRNLWRNEAPGRAFRYSNLAYGILASIIEIRSNERFDRYCKKHIFEPLDMSSSFYAPDFTAVSDLATLYKYDQKKRSFYRAADPAVLSPPAADMPFSGAEPGYNGIIFSPQGGLRSSTGDLARLLQALMNGGTANGQTILSEKTLRTMQQVAWQGPATERFFHFYGLGFHITEDIIPGRRLIGHRGMAYGLQADMYFDPKKKIGVLLVYNGGLPQSRSGVYMSAEEDIFRYVYHKVAMTHTRP